MKEQEMRDIEEIKVLNKLCQCAEMGVVGINTVIDKAQKEEFRSVLLTQKKEYDGIMEKIISVLKKYGCKEKKLGTMPKVSSEILSMMKTKLDNTDSQIAKMMVEGSNKGILEVAKVNKEYQGKDSEVEEIILKFLETEQHNLEEIKKYL